MIPTLDDILEQVRAGRLSPAAAARRVHDLAAEPLGFATVDHTRPMRCGSAEVIYAAGKTPAQVAAIAKAIRIRNPNVLITRATADHVAAVRRAFPRKAVRVGNRAGTILVGPCAPDAANKPIPILTAGTSDEAVAEEAELTMLAMGHAPLRINDVGVAGLHRLGARLDELREANVLVVIAGMEGALPSIVGGLVDCPVIAVPTSVGYGAALGGLTALMGMLTGCAAGVAVVNIDNGFGAAATACRINGLLKRPRRREDAKKKKVK